LRQGIKDAAVAEDASSQRRATLEKRRATLEKRRATLEKRRKKRRTTLEKRRKKWKKESNAPEGVTVNCCN
jgi:flagellar motility protein MotE (MotC chaperone)